MLRLPVIVGFVLACANAILYSVPVTTHIWIDHSWLASELKLRCEVNGNAEAVVWYKDFERISSDDRITVAENVLKMSSVNTNDTGVYGCFAFNVFYSNYSRVKIIVEETTESDITSATGSTTDNAQSIIITPYLGTLERLDTSSTLVPVTTQILLESTRLAPGSELNLLCEVNGYPMPEVYWFKNRAQISSDERITIAENRLTVSRTNIFDGGLYSCRAFNAFSTHNTFKVVRIEDRRWSLPEDEITTTETTESDISSSAERTIDNGASIITEESDTSDRLDTSSTGDRWWSLPEDEFTTTETTESDISSTAERTIDNGASIITEESDTSDRLDTSSTGDRWWSLPEDEFTTTETTESDISSTAERTIDNGASIITEESDTSDRLDTSSTGDRWWSLPEDEFTTTETTESDISSTAERTIDNGASIITEESDTSDRLDTSSTGDRWWSLPEDEFTTTETTESDISSTAERTIDNGASIITEESDTSDRLDTSSTGDRWWSLPEDEFTTTETTESDISSTAERTIDNGASIITEESDTSDRLDTSSTGDRWWSLPEDEFTTTETTESDISSTAERTIDNGASIITEESDTSDRLDTSSTGDRWWSLPEDEFTTTETTESDISSTAERTIDNGASIITEESDTSDRLDTSSTGDRWWSLPEDEFTTTETTESDISSTAERTIDNGASIITEESDTSDRLDTSSTGDTTDSTTAESSTNYSIESSTTESDEADRSSTEPTAIREDSMSPVPVTTHILSERTWLAPGSVLHLLCEVDGYPVPEVYWYKDFALISSDDRITVTETHLTVSRATIHDTGVYSCHAFNAINSHYSSVQIKVEGLYIPPTCEDYPYIANCNLIVRSKFCYNKLFSNFCCKSCVEAGQLNLRGLHAVAGRRVDGTLCRE